MQRLIESKKHNYPVFLKKIQKIKEEYFFLEDKEKQEQKKIKRIIGFRTIEEFLAGEKIGKENSFSRGLYKEEELEDKICELFIRGKYSFGQKPEQDFQFQKISFHERVNLLYPSKNSFAIIRQLTISNYKKLNEGLKLQRPDLLIYVNKKPLVIIELKSPKRYWTECETEAKQQILRYLKTTGPVLKNVLIAIITNGRSLEYSFPPFEKWNYIYNASQFLELIANKTYFLNFLLLAEATTSKKFQEELLNIST